MKKITLLLFGIVLLINFANALTNEDSCSRIYFWILNNNYHYTNISLANNNISLSQIYDYEKFCSDSKYPKLSQPSLKKLIVYQNDPQECNYQDSFFEVYIPFIFEIPIGEMNCSQLKKWSYLADFEKKTDGYSVVGVSAFASSLLIFLLIVGGIKLIEGNHGKN